MAKKDRKSKDDLIADFFSSEYNTVHIVGEALVITDTNGNPVATINNPRVLSN